MGLNSLAVLGLSLALVVGTAKANDDVVQEMNRDYLTIQKVKISRVTTDVLNQEISEILAENEIHKMALSDLPGMPDKTGQVPTTEKVGKIISIGRDLVALGEDIYRLVVKGKPNVKTSYAPISILPRVNGEHVDILDTENWKMPAKATFEILYENLYGMDVVKFRYSVVFSYGGSYNGRGAYVTAAQIIPESVNVMFGFDFNATMKLGGMTNMGTKDNPIAAAILSMQYEVSNILQSNIQTESYHVTGKGGLKQI